MAIVLHNSLSKKKEEFKPLHPPEVKMYVCGPTVYNFLHVGNFRGPVVFNLLRNWLEYRGYKVTYALNFTDVDDKIINRAKDEGTTAEAISEKYIHEYKKDFQDLGLKPHELNPKVTEAMDDIISIVQKLIDNKKAYVANGDVLYSVKNFAGYGKLSGRHIDELIAGARVEVDEKKENPMDFALWKAAKSGEPAWDSPWGPGRPGWHIECSAMICKHLGEQIDIHGGGADLIFPHHENEIAQSEGATGKKFVNYWLHVNMLNFSGQKMSKSLGNFVTMREFLSQYHPELYKWMILSVHYRSTCDFGQEAIERAVTGLGRIYSALALAESYLPDDRSQIKADPGFHQQTIETWKKIEASLDDDLNTAEAFAAMFELVRLFNSQVKRGLKVNPAIQGKALAFIEFFKKFGSVLALFQQPAAQFLHQLDDQLLLKMNLQRSLVEQVVNERTAARQNKDFARSDELRSKLNAMGISVSDTPEGSFWEVAK